ncbi:MAG TPA: hypothetical protein VF528_13455 [Pyrinomonadaceae bacterium]|jgi:hypothetical protein
MNLPHQVKERPHLALATLVYFMVALTVLTLVLLGRTGILEYTSGLIGVGLWLIVEVRTKKRPGQ